MLQQTREFNSFFDPRTRVKRPWIRNLTTRGNKPVGWFGGDKSWSRYRGRWMNYLREAEAFIVAPPRAMCPSADDYGAKTDPPKKCYRRVRCLGGNTFQAYWDLSKCRRRRR